LQGETAKITIWLRLYPVTVLKRETKCSKERTQREKSEKYIYPKKKKNDDGEELQSTVLGYSITQLLLPLKKTPTKTDVRVSDLHEPRIDFQFDN
jgi:hypothetical protein